MKQAALDPRCVERLLVVCLDNLGDLVFTASLVPPLKEHFKSARITLWCKDYAADVAALMPAVDEIVTCDPFWDRAPGRNKGSFVRFTNTVRALRGERFDLAVITSPQWRATAAVRFTGAKVRLAQERHRNRRFLTHVLAPADPKLPVLVDHAHLLAALGVPHEPLRYVLDRERLRSERERIERALTGPFTALHAFASDRLRCVALIEWLEVARDLVRRGDDVVWVGSAAELKEVRARTTAADRWRFASDLTDGSLRETAALISAARLFVGHDSGPMHIAAALGIPVVGVFAPGQPLRTLPQGIPPYRVLHAPTPDQIGARAILAAIEDVNAKTGVPI